MKGTASSIGETQPFHCRISFNLQFFLMSRIHAINLFFIPPFGFKIFRTLGEIYLEYAPIVCAEVSFYLDAHMYVLLTSNERKAIVAASARLHFSCSGSAKHLLIFGCWVLGY